MGKLLSSAIKMQNGSAASPTLVVNFIEYYAGGVVEVYKNGSYYGSPTSGTPLNVPIVAGNTFYITLIPAFDGTFTYAYKVNGSTITSGLVFGPSTLTTTTITASGTNAYVYDTSHDSGA
jgi:hypothetical protein